MESIYIQSFVQQWQDSQRIIVVANEGSVFVDICSSPNGKDKYAQIWGLNVSEKHRGKGVGGVLLSFAEREAKRRGASKIELTWKRPTPIWVYNWYLGKGYVETDFADGYSELRKTL